MSIRMHCPSCGEIHKVPDRLLGKRIRCECGEAFRVKDTSQGSSRDGDKQEAEPGSKRGLWIAGGVLGGVLLVALVFVLLVTRKPREDEQARGPDPAVETSRPPEQPAPKPEAPAPKEPTNPGPNPPAEPPKPQTVAWRARPDPAPIQPEPPAQTNKPIVLGQNPQIYLPSSPGPVIVIASSIENQRFYQKVDLQSFKVGSLMRGSQEFAKAFVSPDGRCLLGPNGPRWHRLDLVEGKELPPWDAAGEAVGFVDNERVLVVEIVPVPIGPSQFSQDLKRFTILDFASGEQKARYEMKTDHMELHLSPGGKYFVMIRSTHSTAPLVYETATGQLVGELKFPTLTGDTSHRTGPLAFSPDGEEVAIYAIAQRNGPGTDLRRMVSWKMATGEVAVVHEYARGPESLLQNRVSYKGPVLEWLPDRSGWLVSGRIWLDYDSGAPIYALDRFDTTLPRRQVGTGHINVFEEILAPDRRNRRLRMQFFALPREEMAAAARQARDRHKVQFRFPAARAGDLAAARSFAAGQPDAPYRVTADPSPAPPAPPKMKALDLPVPPSAIHDIVFPHERAGQVVVVASAAPDPLSSTRQARADRFDAATGQLLASVPLYASEFLNPVGKGPEPEKPDLAGAGELSTRISPDGTRLLVHRKSEPTRLDLWNLEDPKHLVGWIPEQANAITWFEFLDRERVWTLNKNRLVLWNVPEGKALYTCAGVEGRPGLSAGRKWLAFVAKKQVEIIESATGELCGRLKPAAGWEVFGLLPPCFSSQGDVLVAPLGHLDGAHLGIWDLTQGTFVKAIVAGKLAEPLCFLSPRNLLCGQYLYDLNCLRPLRSYMQEYLLARECLGGKVWLCGAAGNPPNFTSTITPAELLDRPTQDLCDQLARGQIRPVVPPGAVFRLQMETPGGKRNDYLSGLLKEGLELRGFKVGNGGYTLRMQFVEQAAGGVTRKKSNGQLIGIPRYVIQVAISVLDGNGREIFSGGHTIDMPSALEVEAEDLVKDVLSYVWSATYRWILTYRPPTHLYQTADRIITLPISGRWLPR
jgi:hypothetical protein